jgi:nucleotide-binding universal stress UspA family protein
MYKNILVAIDDSETSVSALKEALHIARTSQARLYIAHVVDEILLNMHGHAMLNMGHAATATHNLVEAGKKLLATAMQAADGIDAEPLLIEARNRRISETIAEQAKTLGVDLIIIGRHGQRGLATLILGSVAEQLARISEASVLLVRKH